MHSSRERSFRASSETPLDELASRLPRTLCGVVVWTAAAAAMWVYTAPWYIVAGAFIAAVDVTRNTVTLELCQPQRRQRGVGGA